MLGGESQTTSKPWILKRGMGLIWIGCQVKWVVMLSMEFFEGVAAVGEGSHMEMVLVSLYGVKSRRANMSG